MRNLLAIALLVLSATPGVWAQNTDAASDKIVVVGNRAQPVQWNHREDIQSAINAAQPNGTVIIPSSYAGTDCNPVANCNPGSVIVQDWRTNSGGSGVNCGGINAIVFQSAIGQLAICDPNATLDGNGNLTAVSVTAGTVGTAGPGGILDLQLQAPPTSVPVGHAYIFANFNTGLFDCLKSGLVECFSGIQRVTSGSSAMPTSSISAGGCTIVTTAATGVTTSSQILPYVTVDVTGITGYGPSVNGGIYIDPPFPTTNNVNFKVCNNTSAPITPGALTVFWNVI